jgi:WD40 repeat protein
MRAMAAGLPKVPSVCVGRRSRAPFFAALLLLFPCLLGCPERAEKQEAAAPERLSSRGTARRVTSGKVRLRFDWRAHDSIVWQVAFSADGRKLASAGVRPPVVVWDADRERQLLTLAYPYDDGSSGNPRELLGVRTLAFSPDGRALAGGALGRVIAFWNLGDGAVRRTIENGHGAAAVAYSPDGRLLAAAGPLRDTPAALYDCADGAQVREFSSGAREADCVAFSGTGRVLMLGLEDRARGAGQRTAGSTILVFDPVSGRQLRRCRVPTGPVRALAMPPQEDAVIVTTAQGVYVCDLGRGTYRTLLRSAEGILCAGLARDGRTLTIVGRTAIVFV